MPLDLATIGKKLAAARENAGLSQAQAAEAVGLPRSAISLIETGDRTLSTLELAGLATLYRRTMADLLDADESPRSNLTALCRVSEAFGTAPQTAQTIQELINVCREGALIEQMLKRSPRQGPPAYTLPAPRNYVAAAEQGIAIAHKERRRLGLGDSPISDIAELLASEGIWTARADLPNEMSGLFIRDRDIGLAVIVNKSHPAARTRFSYAHEYAHALFDRDHVLSVTTRENSKQLIERRANAFAAAFLMPQTGTRELLESLRAGEPSRKTFTTYDVACESGSEAQKRSSPGSQVINFTHPSMVAYHFGVSYQAACYRIKDLGCINREQLSKLLDDEEHFGKRYLELLPKGGSLYKSDPEGRELEQQMVPLIIDALRADEISEAKARAIAKSLGLARDKIETLLALGEAVH
jgi:Zn-dependent peptidase ImmA (M78 family)/DNA-binding XRE family transcriptional regulator